MGQSIAQVISTDPDKCVNCHNCIAVCPVKFCNDASGDYIVLDYELCVGCGECIKACTHDARVAVDDTEAFVRDVSSGIKTIAIVAPAVVANFPDEYLNLNGWLKSLGVKAIFDVSFGAELTVRTYLEHITENKPQMVIAQPCPALVTYIELYRPELLPHLAPAHSPMLHTVQMIKEYYKEYDHHRVIVVSPCLAKRREFDETQLGDYNVTMVNLRDYLEREGIDLKRFEATEYDNPPAERAVLFSTPGGLLRTAERWDNGISNLTRKIEGPQSIYHYLDGLGDSVKKGINPLLVDCLNCEMGCNGGTGTGSQHKTVDELEHYIEERRKEAQAKYKKDGFRGEARTKKSIEKLIGRYWKPGLYDRSYVDRSRMNNVLTPTQDEIYQLYGQMLKAEERDVLNCGSCGYGSCEKMAIAIYNGLNKAENCYLYREKLLESLGQDLSSSRNYSHSRSHKG